MIFRSIGIVGFIFMFLMTLTSNELMGQKDETLERYTTLSTGYGLGGVWYLNTLDQVHFGKIHLAHGVRSGMSQISLKTGYEFAEETSFLPILVEIERSISNKSSLALDMGYAVAFNDDLDDQSDIRVRGGTAASLRYQYHWLKKTERPQLLLSIGYVLRSNSIENVTNQISSDQFYHFLEVGLGFRF